MSFADLNLSKPLLDAIAEQGYETPSPIQAQAIPAVLAGEDVMAAAQTGTGKTAGFTLPILQRLSTAKRASNNQVKALVLTPTRELAAQVADSVETYSKHIDIRSTVVFGGVKINPQMMRLRSGVEVLVATPGRLLDLYQQNAVKFDQLEVLVLDEADRMLDMGFIRDIKKILAVLPKQRQNLLFSATFSDEIRDLAKGLVNNPVEVSVAPPNQTAKTIEQWIVPTDKKKKAKLLAYLIGAENWQQVLVFTKTKHGANRLTRDLEGWGINAAAIHGNKSQGARTKALAQFKDGRTRVLVATDIAARGIDIDQLPHVVNFELPHVSEDYVHRIGRTGRAGSVGHAVSLVCADEFKLLKDIERLTKQVIDRKIIPDFEPVNELPESKLDTRPFKAKKPKKAKQPKAEHHDGQRSGESARGHKPQDKNTKHKSADGNRKPKSNKGRNTSSHGSNNKSNKPSHKAGGNKGNPNRAPKSQGNRPQRSASK